MSARIDVVSAVLVRRGRVLLTQRDPMRSDFGYAWESPGGKVDTGESLAQALCREIGEELGVDSEIGEELARFEFDQPIVKVPIRLTFLRVLHTSGHLAPLQSIGMGWFTAEEIAGLTMVPGNNAFRAEMQRIALASVAP